MEFRIDRRAACLLLAAALLPLGAAAAAAPEHASRDEARAMVDAAVAHVRQVGPQQAWKDFTDKSNAAWHRKDLYVFAYATDGTCVAHGVNDRLVGKNLLDMKDVDGKPLIRELRDTAAKGGGWVDYQWPDPLTKKVEAKTSYVRRTDNFDGFVGAGVYR
ncbi:MAG TPA: cache domain-containing protein [Burkholderiaceae bacterium]